MEHYHANFSSSVASCQRLAMSPSTQHGISLARVELGDDDDLHSSDAAFHPRHGGVGGIVVHRRRCVMRVCWASLALEVWPVRKEIRSSASACSREYEARGGRGAMANRDSVEHAATPAVLAGQRRPVHVKAPAHAQVGKRQQSGEGGASKRGHGPDLHGACLAHQAVAPAASHLPGGMRSAAVSRLRKIELEALGKQQKAVEKPVWKHDVVVEDEQPVVHVGGIRVQQQVEVSNLPRSAGEPRQSSTR